MLRGVKYEQGDLGVDFVSCQEIPMGPLVARVGHVMDNSFTRVLNERVLRSRVLRSVNYLCFPMLDCFT